jgi:MinD superfamily P-loop ATPase
VDTWNGRNNIRLIGEGGKKMELNKAIKKLEPFINDCDKCHLLSCEGCQICHTEVQAIKTILNGLVVQYNKGYQDGFKQAKFEVEMDKLQEGKLVEKLQEQYKQGYQDGYMAGAMESI